MMRKFVTCLLLGVVLLVFVGAANATLTTFASRPAFTLQGIIAENYGFEDFTGQPYYLVGDPWTTHGVTYTTGFNGIAGPSLLSVNPASNIFLSNYWTPLPGTINSIYTMFGFDLGFSGVTSQLDLSITTSLSVYSFNNLVVPNVNTHTMNFYGFVAGAGEYFTSFNISSQYGFGSAPAIDNVTLGRVSDIAVPIPGAVWLLGSGLLGLTSWRRFRKN